MSHQVKAVAAGTLAFGEPNMRDKRERANRFLEEALELVRACGITRDEIVRMTDYEFSRSAGDIP